MSGLSQNVSSNQTGFIDVYSALGSSEDHIIKIKNNTQAVTYDHIVVYSDYMNYNMSLYRNSIFEKFCYSKMIFDVYEYDNITIITEYLKFEFFVSDISAVPLEEYEFDMRGSIKFFTNIGRGEIITAIIMSLIFTLIIRYFHLRRK